MRSPEKTCWLGFWMTKQMNIVQHVDESIEQVLKGIRERLDKRRKVLRQGDKMRKFIDKLDFEKRLRNKRKRTGEK